MKGKFKNSLKRTLAFVAALVIIAPATFFAAKATETDAQVTNTVDDYTNLFPGLRDTKLKLSDPQFSEKDWYEYVEYVFYSEVQDGDMIYRIYQPDDYAMASIMAIGDYNPNEILGNQTNLSMNLGELQGIFDIASQGTGISKEFAGLNVVSGIAENMNSINEVMDNSKYYSNSSFLGIPNDSKYTGVSNDGFYNADSLSITVERSITVSTCKTIALNSGYSMAESNASSKDFSTYKEVGEAKSTAKEESLSQEITNSSGMSISNAVSNSTELSSVVSETLEQEVSETITDTIGSSIGSEIGAEGFGVEAKVTAEITAELSDSYTVGTVNSQTYETGISNAVTNEQSITSDIQSSITGGSSTTNSSSIENSLTNGENSTIGQENAKEMAVDIGYGVDYAYGQEESTTVAVERTFNAREEDEVKNVGWKLCEYVVKIPYYIEAVKVDSSGEETVLYGQYVNYNLLNGVSRVFANGYIEHWYTGELVAYADFFEGFITANELVDMAKDQAAAKIG